VTAALVPIAAMLTPRCRNARFSVRARYRLPADADPERLVSRHEGGSKIAGTGAAMNLDGVTMFVSSTAEQGVVSSETRIRFAQRGPRVLGRYSGGSVARGCLIGRLTGSELVFRYAQREASGEIHGGRSVCEVDRLADGRIRIVEHFQWSTRAGSGTNVFEEIAENRRNG